MSELDVVPYLSANTIGRTESPVTNPNRVEKHTSTSNGNAPASTPSPLRSMDTFNSYCTQVQSRLAEQTAHRTDFLQAAYERLTRLLQAAKAVEDTALYSELWQHRVAARELLQAVSQFAQPTVAPPAKPLPQPFPSSVERSEPTRETLGSFSAPTSPPPYADSRPTSTPYSNGYPSQPTQAVVEQRLPRRPLRPLADIEANAIRMREELQEWAKKWPLKNPAGDLNVPNGLRLRAFACRQRRLEEEAGDTEVAEVTELAEDIMALMEAAGDKEYTVALDMELDPHPTPYQWNDLAERYEEMARAQEAIEWWNRHHAALTIADIQPMAEAVAAIQQRFNRLLFRIGARDPFQQQLFDDLRTWAKEAQCYLNSLRPKVPISELVERAGMLEEAWAQATEPVATWGQRVQSVDNVIALVSDPAFGTELERDEERLQVAVIECKAMRIPPSDRRLRDALLPWGAFLESDEQFKDVLREINLEWERQQESGRPDVTEEECDANLDTVSAELSAVREATRGKRCLILGGTCREEHRRKIEEALELRELVWPSTKPSDPLSRFETEIRHSEIVALLTRFSRKEWKNAQDICARDSKKFVHLTTGYGVAQVVRHFYNQICPEGAGR